MSLSDDLYDYENYDLEFYMINQGPPLITTISRIIFSVVQNDVETLAQLLDSPKWYRVTDKDGISILQVAIMRDNQEVFDYMLSLENFPIDEPNRNGKTALEISLTFFISSGMWLRDHYAFELLQRDVKIDTVVSYEDNTFLHCAFDRCFIRVARLLLEKGADVDKQNADGYTPLHSCCTYCDKDDFIEGITMLLCYGADVSLRDREDNTVFDIIMKGPEPFWIKETLFYYTFDQFTCMDIKIGVLLRMAQNKCPLFSQVLEKVSKVICDDHYHNLISLFLIEPQYLQLLMEKCENTVETLLLTLLDQPDSSVIMVFNNLVTLEMLINSRFKSLVLELIGKLHSFNKIRYLITRKHSENSIIEIICYLLSYGMNINIQDLQLVYKYFKYGELFNILLHMDIEKFHVRGAIIPALSYDMNVSIDSFLQDPHLFSLYSGIEEVLSYSAHPKLKEFCYQISYDPLTEKVRKLPQIPLLVELARDVFREYFIEKFNITTSRQFYTLLKLLPAGIIHKKIIAFQRKLYL